MNQFTQIITTELDKFIGSFFLQLSSNQSISIDILEKEWNDFCGNETKVMTKNSNQEKIKCAYVFSKGKNTGDQCSKFVKEGQTFCYLHINSKQEKKEEDVSNCLFKLSGTSYWWHKDTRLVFPSQNEKLVIAKYFDGDLQKLEDEDIKLCKKFKLDYDQEYNLKKIYEQETPKTKTKTDIKLVEKKTDIKPVEKKTDIKPVEKKPDIKPVEKKPDIKPVEKKPDIKPVEKKPDVKPVEKKPDIKPVEKKSKLTEKDKNIINFNYSVMPIENVLKKIYDDSASDEYTSEESESSTESFDDSDSFESNDSSSDIDEDSDNDDSDNDSDEESELLEED